MNFIIILAVVGCAMGCRFKNGITKCSGHFMESDVRQINRNSTGLILINIEFTQSFSAPLPSVSLPLLHQLYVSSPIQEVCGNLTSQLQNIICSPQVVTCRLCDEHCICLRSHTSGTTTTNHRVVSTQMTQPSTTEYSSAITTPTPTPSITPTAVNATVNPTATTNPQVVTRSSAQPTTTTLDPDTVTTPTSNPLTIPSTTSTVPRIMTSTTGSLSTTAIPHRMSTTAVFVITTPANGSWNSTPVAQHSDRSSTPTIPIVIIIVGVLVLGFVVPICFWLRRRFNSRAVCNQGSEDGDEVGLEMEYIEPIIRFDSANDSIDFTTFGQYHFSYCSSCNQLQPLYSESVYRETTEIA